MPQRVPLAFLPTPVTPLRRLTRLLDGPELWIKRDDLTGLAFGGNKTRKLEFLMGDAIAQGCDLVVTAGAAQSNHCRQTAAAAAMCGLECHLALGGSEPDGKGGNLLIGALCGAHVHWCGDDRKGEGMAALADALRAEGRTPYAIPYGGSNAVGAAGFVDAARELSGQMDDLGQTFSHLVIASSSGGTQAGLLAGFRDLGCSCEVIGVGIDKGNTVADGYHTRIAALANETSAWLGLPSRIADADVRVDGRFLGAGYGCVGELERRAVGLLAREEGILLDPVYTGRAMGALIEMVGEGAFAASDRVLFWHTGGSPALFPYAADLLS